MEAKTEDSVTITTLDENVSASAPGRQASPPRWGKLFELRLCSNPRAYGSCSNQFNHGTLINLRSCILFVPHYLLRALSFRHQYDVQ